MTAAAALREPGPDGGAVAARLAALTDPVFLAEAGWDPGTRVLSLPSAHPLLGWRACPSPGCGNLLYGSAGASRAWSPGVIQRWIAR